MLSIPCLLALWRQGSVPSRSGQEYLLAAFGISILSLLIAAGLSRYVINQDTGTAQMQKISNAIKQGAETFLRRQNRTTLGLALILAMVIYLGYRLGKGDSRLAIRMAISFVAGALSATLASFSGLWVSVRGNIRTASAARSSLNHALRISLCGGAAASLSVLGLSLLSVSVLFWLFDGLNHPTEVPTQIVAFGFGASFVALFAQLGGGTYAQAAGVAAEFVGKVEAGIPDNDARNPAVIADLVGDNVGDSAARGTDLFESTAAENIGAMILGVALFPAFGVNGILFPLVAHAFGLMASTVGVLTVRTREDRDPVEALKHGYYVTAVLAMIGFYAAVEMLFKGNLMLFSAGVIGIVTSLLFVYITQYYTESKHRPVQSIATACLTGSATTIISGFAIGLESEVGPMIVISTAIMGSYYLGANAGLAGVTPQAAGLYGTAIATMGMLSTAAYILAMDKIGPLTANARGIIEMSRQPEEIRTRTDQLSAVDHPTKVLAKGYAIGSAALAAFVLFSAYIGEVRGLLHKESTTFSLDIGLVPVFTGALLGAMLVYLLSSFALKALSRAAQIVIEEVRRQFRANAGIMEGTADPDYGICLDTLTKSALKATAVPGLLAVASPVAVGVIFRMFADPNDAFPVGAVSVGAFLIVGTVSGILLATLTNNGGGAWATAKKFIETGAYGSKVSDAQKAGGVGDPFKGTTAPSLHVLIKLLSTITLVAAPLFI